MAFAVKMDVEVGAGGETCDVDPWRPGAFLILIVLKSEVNGTHELFTPETLCRQVLHRGKEMTDGQKLLANEQMDCSRAGLAQASPLVPMAPMLRWLRGFDGSDGFDGDDGS